MHTARPANTRKRFASSPILSAREGRRWRRSSSRGNATANCGRDTKGMRRSSGRRFSIRKTISSGAAAAARRGIPVYVPEGEREMFAEPAEHFRRRETYIVYDNLWHHFAPIEGVKIAGVLRDYERIQLAGLDVEVIPQPGATVHQIG